MSTNDSARDSAEEIGPIDYLVVEFPHRRETGEGLPLFVDLVERGIVRVLDLVFIRKERDGRIERLNLADLGPQLAVFEGAASGLLDQIDIDAAAEVIEPDSAAGLVVYENRWAAPFVGALRRSGAQLVARGSIPIQALLEQLDSLEAQAV